MAKGHVSPRTQTRLQGRKLQDLRSQAEILKLLTIQEEASPGWSPFYKARNRFFCCMCSGKGEKHCSEGGREGGGEGGLEREGGGEREKERVSVSE